MTPDLQSATHVLAFMYMHICKPVISSLLAGMALVILSPLLLTISVLLFLSTRKSPFFLQTRVGYQGKLFKIIKFKTMTDARDEHGRLLPDNQRLFPLGNFLRTNSLDELPQLINILKGDMSLIGPRPERPQFVEKFKEEIPRYMIKHQVRPGLTGWAQVNGLRGDTSIQKRIEYDLYYIENWTLGFDIKILFLTFFKGFINKNAY